MTVRHAIMQINYVVRIKDVTATDRAGLTAPEKGSRWVEASKLASLPLTGLARKVLIRAKILTTVGKN
jgi:A/G-specific adenine glycosylase